MTLRTAFFLVPAIAVASTAGLAERQAPKEPLLVRQGFTLVAPTCEGGACPEGPKAWTTGDDKLLSLALNEIARHPDGKDVMARAQRAGVATIRRTTVGFHDAVPVAGIAATLRRERASTDAPRWIELHDRFFALGTARDPYSGKPGYLLAAQLLLHELVHAIDIESHRPEFATLAGFVRTRTDWKFGVTSLEDVKSLNEYELELKRLEQAQDFVGQYHMNRRLAMRARPVRMPSMQSVRGPGEAFAEIGSHLILDSSARKYLPKELVTFFDTKVFHH